MIGDGKSDLLSVMLVVEAAEVHSSTVTSYSIAALGKTIVRHSW